MSAVTAACTCGGIIVAVEGHEAEAVRAHQQTTQHQQWRELGGMEVLVYGTEPLVGLGAHHDQRRPPPEPRMASMGEAVSGLRRALEEQEVVSIVPAAWRGRRPAPAPVAAGGR